jgi:hypothetical protein
LFDDPLRLIGFRREARKERDIRLQVALLQNRGPIRHSEQENVQRRKVQRVVFHVDVDEVDRRPGGFPGIGKRQIARNQAVNRLAFSQLRHDRVQVRRLFLSRRRLESHKRRHDRCGRNDQRGGGFLGLWHRVMLPILGDRPGYTSTRAGSAEENCCLQDMAELAC